MAPGFCEHLLGSLEVEVAQLLLQALQRLGREARNHVIPAGPPSSHTLRTFLGQPLPHAGRAAEAVRAQVVDAPAQSADAAYQAPDSLCPFQGKPPKLYAFRLSVPPLKQWMLHLRHQTDLAMCSNSNQLRMYTHSIHSVACWGSAGDEMLTCS